MISNEHGLIWLGQDGEDCQHIVITDFSDNLKKVFSTSASDNSLATSGQFGLQQIQCGGSYLLKSTGVPYEISSDIVETSLGSNSGLLATNYDEEVDISGFPDDWSNANGTYKLTSRFTEGKPTYKNDHDWEIHWESSEWLLKDDRFNPTKTARCESDDNHPCPAGLWTAVPNGPGGPTAPTPTPHIPTPHIVDIPNLVARWDASYTADGKLVDDNAGGYDFTPRTGVMVRDVDRGHVFDFNSKGKYCEIGNHLTNVFATGNFSISFWCKPRTYVANHMPPCCHEDPLPCCFEDPPCPECCSGCEVGMILAQWYSSGTNLHSRNSFIVYSNGTFVSDIPDGTKSTKNTHVRDENGNQVSPPLDKWTYVTYTLTEGVVDIYWNGVKMSTYSSSDQPHVFATPGWYSLQEPLTMGVLSTNKHYSYNGKLDDVRIYDRPLSAEEVGIIYNSTDSESNSPLYEIPAADATDKTIPVSDEITDVVPYTHNDSASFGSSFSINTSGERDVMASLDGDTIRFYSKGDGETVWVIMDIEIHVYYATNPHTILLTDNLVFVGEEGAVCVYDRPSLTNDNSISAEYEFSQKIDNSRFTGRFKMLFYEESSVLCVLGNGKLHGYSQDWYEAWQLITVEQQPSGEIVDFDIEGHILVTIETASGAGLPTPTYRTRTLEFVTFGTTNFLTTSYIGPSTPFQMHSGVHSIRLHDNHIFTAFSGGWGPPRFPFNNVPRTFLDASSCGYIEITPISGDGAFQTIYPPYLESGVDFLNLWSFGVEIEISESHMVVSAPAFNMGVGLAYLYEKQESGWKFISRLKPPTSNIEDFFGTNIYVGEDYCLVNDVRGAIWDFKWQTDDELTPDQVQWPVSTEDRLLTWWKFDDTFAQSESQHVVFDRSGNYNHLGIQGKMADGQGPEKLLSDGVSVLDDGGVYEFLPDHAMDAKSPIDGGYFTDQDFSIVIWYNPHEFSGVFEGELHKSVLLSKASNDAVQSDMTTFILYADGSVTFKNKSLTTPNQIIKNEWSMLTIVKTGDKSNSTINLYVNDKLTATETAVELGDTSRDLSIAPYHHNTKRFSGYLDDIKIYNRALIADEIKSKFEESWKSYWLG